MPSCTPAAAARLHKLTSIRIRAEHEQRDPQHHDEHQSVKHRSLEALGRAAISTRALCGSAARLSTPTSHDAPQADLPASTSLRCPRTQRQLAVNSCARSEGLDPSVRQAGSHAQPGCPALIVLERALSSGPSIIAAAARAPVKRHSRTSRGCGPDVCMCAAGPLRVTSRPAAAAHRCQHARARPASS
ncbi:hypothetical protein FA09DRAFT_77632 [Tilletiopsis washingtonensis]|uniref:Uncharacterized protein n=1 Tax=Tilletiopsis washingtonensis TaxID=58919 RepID=A0A316Z4R4_9BASI|nr:hypothetical protein FA09DRAFT_77632 [Tilletiopsis washingtonensis]PWN96579.1 hypothetical protein FA09DRAFT_77632 [Tilletiopsis washingtonensis]